MENFHSSSANSFLQYLHATCPGEWGEDRVQSKLTDWHVSTNPCQGSGGMTNCIRENPGSIGYMDSGHGWSEELAEVNVRNKRGNYITSKDSHARGGIAAAASAAAPPSSADDDWSEVEFLLKVSFSLKLLRVFCFFFISPYAQIGRRGYLANHCNELCIS